MRKKIKVKNVNKGKNKYLFISKLGAKTGVKSGVKTNKSQTKTSSLKKCFFPPTKCSQIFQFCMPLGGLVFSSICQRPLQPSYIISYICLLI